MPRERVELIRVSGVRDRERMFLLAYEGNLTEPTYFEALRKTVRFNSDIIEMVSLKRHPKDTKSAPKYVYETLQLKKNEYNLDPNDELWMIIDRDRNAPTYLSILRNANWKQTFFSH